MLLLLSGWCSPQFVAESALVNGDATAASPHPSRFRSYTRGDGFENARRPSIVLHFQRGNERFLRDVDLAELAHALLALFLLLQKFFLTADITAVTLG